MVEYHPQGADVLVSKEEEKAALGHRRGVSETEYLLSQIRNNINTLKAYQPYIGDAPEQPIDSYTNFTNKPA